MANTTTEFDVADAQDEFNEASSKLASLTEQLANGEVEPNGEINAEMSKLAAEVSIKSAELKEKRDEAEYDKSVETAYEMAPDKSALERQSADVSATVSKAIYKAMTGQERVRFAPAVTVDEDKFEIRNPKPSYQYVNGASTLVFQGQITAPDELAQKLFSPPASRRDQFALDPTQSEFTTLTTTTNSPIGVDYFNRIMMQPLWSGKLTDPACVSVVDRPDTQDYVMYNFQARPTTTLLTEGADISETDPEYKSQTLKAWEVGSATSLTKKFELASVDSMAVSRIWDELNESLSDQWNKWLTIGTGINQPHGVYTAAQQAYQNGNNRVYGRDGNTSNFGNDNRNRLTSVGSGSSATDGMRLLMEAYGMVSAGYRDSPKFAYMMHSRFAMHQVTTTDYGFGPNQLFPWANFGGQAPPGVIFQGIGGPVYDNPWLDSADDTDDKKMAVIGDFSKFYVRRSPIDMFVSEHTLAESHKTYLRLTTFTDSVVIPWSPSTERLGPFVYIRADAS